MSNNNDLLTVIITLKDRAKFTYRWMKWMNDNKCPYKILIADGGKDKKIEKHLKDYGNYPDLRYEYIRYPYDENLDLYNKKSMDVGKKAQTKYVVHVDNDDFLIWDYFDEKITFLEEHQDYSCYMGKMEGFLVPLESGNAVYNKDIEFLQLPKYKNAENEKASDRIINVLNNRTDIAYFSIMRKEINDILREEMHNAKIRHLLTYEKWSFMVLALFGKIKIDNKLHHIKQWEQQSEAYAYLNEEEKQYYLLSADYQYDHVKITDCIMRHLKNMEPDLNQKKYSTKYTKAYRHYILPALHAQTCGEVKPNFFILRKIIRSSKFLYKFIVFVRKITIKKIYYKIDTKRLKHEPSIQKIINFLNQNK